MKILASLLLCVFALFAASCSQRELTVTVYASQDQVYAEPILNDFTIETGIRVRAVYDSEAVKTVGLANRLLAEQSNPQCDVFWNNEELRTRQLVAKNVIELAQKVGYRSRRIVINTNAVSPNAAPKSLIDLTNSVWKGKVALAYPLFGTTATHFLALRQAWGAADWERWCRALQANTPFLVDGNSVVVQLVGRGEAAIGLTDSDDIAAGQRQGLPIEALPLEQSSLLIPNTIGIIRGSPHTREANRLYGYLQSDSVRAKLVATGALEGADSPAAGLQVDWMRLLAELDAGTKTLKEVFLR